MREYFSGSLDIRYCECEIPEIQSDSLESIARAKLDYASTVVTPPLMVDDTGFFIPSLKGFPGPYAAYVLRTLGPSGILTLMQGISERRAHFETVIGYMAADGNRHLFSGKVEGHVTEIPRGSSGFGYDSIFEYQGKTLAECTMTEKNQISHRARALSALTTYLINAND